MRKCWDWYELVVTKPPEESQSACAINDPTARLATGSKIPVFFKINAPCTARGNTLKPPAGTRSGSCRPRDKGPHLRSPVRRPVLFLKHPMALRLQTPVLPSPDSADTDPTATPDQPPSRTPDSHRNAAASESPRAPRPKAPALPPVEF